MSDRDTKKMTTRQLEKWINERLVDLEATYEKNLASMIEQNKLIAEQFQKLAQTQNTLNMLAYEKQQATLRAMRAEGMLEYDADYFSEIGHVEKHGEWLSKAIEKDKSDYEAKQAEAEALAKEKAKTDGIVINSLGETKGELDG